MRGEWIEISASWVDWGSGHSLSPCGESGLKFLGGRVFRQVFASLPMRGEWIEMIYAGEHEVSDGVSPHAGRVD